MFLLVGNGEKLMMSHKGSMYGVFLPYRRENTAIQNARSRAKGSAEGSFETLANNSVGFDPRLVLRMCHP